MARILFVKASDRSEEESVSMKLYYTFLRKYRQTHPEDMVEEVDLYEEELPYLGSVMIKSNAKSARQQELTEQEQRVRDIVVRHLKQFTAADKIVIAFPLWNLTVPAVLHSYFDFMHHPGKTFKYTEEGQVGLLSDKKAVLLNARGGVYEEDDRYEMAVNFVRNQLNFFGITNISPVIIEGHHQFPETKQVIIEEGLRQAEETAAGF
ncbi:FMN-dependent NADH-azoreductase [Salibacterium aidingense]|uniref:FMN-dependent NADH-azoreductase n=1 Tax=Salibacterium aidingense TaxID=384933 RepID=UPI00047B553E|nr:FMN-dependent NADH-azoreductase [Salibacterium aidingense]